MSYFSISATCGKVWVIKTCTHIFTHSTILCQFFKNMYYFEEIRLVEHSKLLRQVKILQKMCPLHSHLKKKNFHIFWIFMWNRCTKFFKTRLKSLFQSMTTIEILIILINWIQFHDEYHDLLKHNEWQLLDVARIFNCYIMN